MPRQLENMHKEHRRPTFTDGQVLLFVFILCFICASLLALVSFSLEKKQLAAKEFDQSKQMLIAAKILNSQGYFEILQPDGSVVLANYDSEKKQLIEVPPDQKPEKAKDEAILDVAKSRICPLLTNESGEIFSLAEKNIDLGEYLNANKKIGYAHLPLKLFYAVFPDQAASACNDPSRVLIHAEAFVFPISGYGLWGPIYGFLAVAKDGNTVIGTTWYEHAETPGLGANITEASWQKQFYGKLIFQQNSNGKTDFEKTPMGILVIRGKVKDIFGTSPKSKSAVDGISGGTLTGDGVTAGYQNSLTPYRQLLIRIHQASSEKKHDS